MALPSDQLCRHYSLADIRSATQNFADSLVIGQGGFGKVYRGHIFDEKRCSTLVAIKRLESMSLQGEYQFRAEIETLSKLRHAYLVSLLGFCAAGEERILVYEYMPHETVYHHLHDSTTTLSWMLRLRISIGAARGLDYLHTGAGVKHGVVHRDVKSSNILLDVDWAARISDFGLAKICKINQTSSSYVHTGIKGTFGYMDPEIFMTGKFTSKTDVFAFGVVLFELLSGKRAVLPVGDEDFSLARLAQKCVKKRNLDQIVETEIKGQISPKCLKEFAQIAFRCLHSDPKERPTMSQVVVALQLALALQEKFDSCAKPRGLVGFTWKTPSYFSRKEESGHSDEKSSRNNKNNSDCSLLPTDDRGDYYEVLPDNEQTHAQDLKIFSYTDLNCAISNFQHQIKGARCGTSYKGWVNDNTYSSSKLGVGLAITVTRLIRRAEMDIHLLGEFSHPNLQKLLGYCLKDDDLFLVHEFMERRTLNDYLRKEAAAELTFLKRVKIVVGVARGLAFLQRKQLIIKDWILDGNDIWLDKDFNAKLFNLDAARMINELSQYPLIGGKSSQISGSSFRRRQCDVYGLGMLLMEILTGKAVFTIKQISVVMKEHLSGYVLDMSDMVIKNVHYPSDMVIKNLVDPRMKLQASQIEEAREIIYLILDCSNSCCTMDQASERLEKLYTRMTRR